MTITEVWASIYWTFPDNSYDYYRKVLNDDNS